MELQDFVIYAIANLALSLQERRLNSPLVRSFANLLYLLFPLLILLFTPRKAMMRYHPVYDLFFERHD